MNGFGRLKLFEALGLLEEHMRTLEGRPVVLVVCGGSALMACHFVSRTTHDVDVVALVDQWQNLIDPEPLPHTLISAATLVADTLGLSQDWLNTGPADIFRMGLPSGFQDRLVQHKIGECLSVSFISRLDQIYFKLYASVDRGGYHIDDLLALNPTEDELVAAACWTTTHDVSEGFLMLLKKLFRSLGYGVVAQRI